jgi:hypothetical protein
MINFDIIKHQTELPIDVFVDTLMRRRVRQGCPEEVIVKIEDEPKIAYQWTDGVDTVLSIFVSNEGLITEIAVIRHSTCELQTLR